MKSKEKIKIGLNLLQGLFTEINARTLQYESHDTNSRRREKSCVIH